MISIGGYSRNWFHPLEAYSHPILECSDVALKYGFAPNLNVILHICFGLLHEDFAPGLNVILHICFGLIHEGFCCIFERYLGVGYLHISSLYLSHV